MLKHYCLFFYILASPLCIAQNDSLLIQQNQISIKSLEAKTQYLNSSLNIQSKQFRNLQYQLEIIRSRNDSLNENLHLELAAFTKNMERFQASQAQTERALNNALLDFQAKFEAQNEYAQKMQSTLDSRIQLELIYAAATGIILIILFLAFNKLMLKRGLKQNLASWNQFQDHFLKKSVS